MAADRPSSAAPPTRPSPRLLTLAAGLGVAVLAGAAFVLTYQDLRTLALAGGAARRWAPAYPLMVDALITVTVLALVAARQARWWSRWLRWALLVLLLGGAAAAGVQRAVKGYDPLPDQPLKAGVAIAPHLLILIAVWLWLTMFRHVRQARRPAAEEEPKEPEPEEPEPKEPAPVEREREERERDMIPGLAEPVPPPPEEDPRVPEVPAEMTGGRPDEDPTPPSGFPVLLPTDVELVRTRPSFAATTQPDFPVPLPQDEPDPAEDDDEEPMVDRAEDPDAGDADEDIGRGRHRLRRSPDPGDSNTLETTPDLDADEVARWTSEAAEAAGRWADETADEAAIEWTPPSSKFRSSPTPPQD